MDTLRLRYEWLFCVNRDAISWCQFSREYSLNMHGTITDIP